MNEPTVEHPDRDTPLPRGKDCRIFIDANKVETVLREFVISVHPEFARGHIIDVKRNGDTEEFVATVTKRDYRPQNQV